MQIKNKFLSTIVSVIIIATSQFSCSPKEEVVKLPDLTKPSVPFQLFDAQVLLPGSIDSVSLTLESEPVELLADTTSTDSLLKYHNFVGQISGKYSSKSDAIIIVVRQFATDADAFGYFQKTKPTNSTRKPLGGEAFGNSHNLSLFQGAYVYSVSFVDSTISNEKKLSSIANLVSSQIDAPKSLPTHFILFFYNWKIKETNNYHPYNYLNVGGVNEVFSADYSLDNSNDTISLFLTMDKTGQKYLKLLSYAQSTGRVIENPKNFKFDENYGFAFEHPELGIIVAGLVRSKLVGVINFDPVETGDFVTGWVKGLQ